MNQKKYAPGDFVTIELGSPVADVLRTTSSSLIFPLSYADQHDIKLLKEKYFATENCAGLAAPQIGIPKKIIIYAVDEQIKEWRDDVNELVPVRVLINPSYRPLKQDKTIDWEGCFSVESIYGEVPRYSAIEFEGLNEQGERIAGIATGFHARLLQHEIGHLERELFIDLFTEECRRGDLETVRALRMKELEEKGKKPR